jgi:hypothetical protein
MPLRTSSTMAARQWLPDASEFTTGSVRFADETLSSVVTNQAITNLLAALDPGRATDVWLSSAYAAAAQDITITSTDGVTKVVIPLAQSGKQAVLGKQFLFTVPAGQGINISTSTTAATNLQLAFRQE